MCGEWRTDEILFAAISSAINAQLAVTAPKTVTQTVVSTVTTTSVSKTTSVSTSTKLVTSTIKGQTVTSTKLQTTTVPVTVQVPVTQYVTQVVTTTAAAPSTTSSADVASLNIQSAINSAFAAVDLSQSGLDNTTVASLQACLATVLAQGGLPDGYACLSASGSSGAGLQQTLNTILEQASFPLLALKFWARTNSFPLSVCRNPSQRHPFRRV